MYHSVSFDKCVHLCHPNPSIKMKNIPITAQVPSGPVQPFLAPLPETAAALIFIHHTQVSSMPELHIDGSYRVYSSVKVSFTQHSVF